MAIKKFDDCGPGKIRNPKGNRCKAVENFTNDEVNNFTASEMANFTPHDKTEALKLKDKFSRGERIPSIAPNVVAPNVVVRPTVVNDSKPQARWKVLKEEAKRKNNPAENLKKSKSDASTTVDNSQKRRFQELKKKIDLETCLKNLEECRNNNGSKEEIANLVQQVENLQAQIVAKDQKVEDFKAQIVAANAKIVTQEEAKNDVESANTQCQRNLEMSEKTLDETLKQHQKDLDERRTEIENILRESGEKDARNIELVSRVNSLEKDLRDCLFDKGSMKGKLLKLSTLEEDVRKLNVEIESRKEDLKKCKAENVELQGKIDTLNQQISDRFVQIDEENEAKLSGLKQEKQQIEQEIRSLKELDKSRTETIKDLEDIIKREEERNERNDSRIELLEKQLENCNSEKEKMKQELTEKETSLNEVSVELSQLKIQYEQNVVELTACETISKEFKDKLEKFSVEFTINGREVDRIKIFELSTEIEHLKGIISTKDLTITDLESNLEKTKESLEETKESLKNLLINSDSKLNTANSANEELVKRVNKCEKELLDCEKERKRLELREKDLLYKIEDLRSTHSSSMSKVEGDKQRIDVENGILKDQISDLNNEIQELKEEIERREREHSTEIEENEEKFEAEMEKAAKESKNERRGKFITQIINFRRESKNKYQRLLMGILFRNLKYIHVDEIDLLENIFNSIRDEVTGKDSVKKVLGDMKSRDFKIGYLTRVKLSM